MAQFDRFDIAEAHCVLEWDYNLGGWLRERPTNQRRKEATAVQLMRIGFTPAPNLSFDSLSENGQEIYLANVLRWKLPRDEEQNARIKSFFAADWLREAHPELYEELYGEQGHA